jgi:hypothetical protein
LIGLFTNWPKCYEPRETYAGEQAENKPAPSAKK